jgi:hypothetical protein
LDKTIGAVPNTRSEASGPMEKLLNDLEKLAGQASVHRKNFEYSVNQFRRFLVAFSGDAASDAVIIK